MMNLIESIKGYACASELQSSLSNYQKEQELRLAEYKSNLLRLLSPKEETIIRLKDGRYIAAIIVRGDIRWKYIKVLEELGDISDLTKTPIHQQYIDQTNIVLTQLNYNKLTEFEEKILIGVIEGLSLPQIALSVGKRKDQVGGALGKLWVKLRPVDKSMSKGTYKEIIKRFIGSKLEDAPGEKLSKKDTTLPDVVQVTRDNLLEMISREEVAEDVVKRVNQAICSKERFLTKFQEKLLIGILMGKTYLQMAKEFNTTGIYSNVYYLRNKIVHGTGTSLRSKEDLIRFVLGLYRHH